MNTLMAEAKQFQEILFALSELIELANSRYSKDGDLPPFDDAAALVRVASTEIGNASDREEEGKEQAVVRAQG